MKIGKKVLGKTLFAALMKPTFYGQFVAGEVRFKTFSLPFPFLFLFPLYSLFLLSYRKEMESDSNLTSRKERKQTPNHLAERLLYSLKKCPSNVFVIIILDQHSSSLSGCSHHRAQY